MAERSQYAISSRTLKLPGLKPSDYFLLKEIKAYFGFGLREVLVLGLRWCYAAWHNAEMRTMIIHLASEIKGENLDSQGKEVVYTKIREIP